MLTRRFTENAFRNSRDLIKELCRHSRKDQIWVVGSGLTVPVFKDCTEELVHRGVPGTIGMIDMLATELEQQGVTSAHAFREELERIKEEDDVAPYQAAFRFAERRLNTRVLNSIVRSAVLQAYTGDLSNSQRERIQDGELRDCNDILAHIDKWHLRPGIQSIGQIVSHTSIKHTILTTNFDPLIEMAVRRAAGSPITMLMDSDDVLSYTQTELPRIAHLHGYWFGSGLLHTSAQLLKERLRLKVSIAGMLKGQDVFVFGYGGWRDVLREALREALADNPSTYVHWCFFEAREQIERDYEKLLHAFRHSIDGGRFLIYAGIDADKDLAEACNGLSNPGIQHTVFMEGQLTKLEKEKSVLEDRLEESQARICLLEDLEHRTAKFDDAIADAKVLVGSLLELSIEMKEASQTWLSASREGSQEFGFAMKKGAEMLDDGIRKTNLLFERFQELLADSTRLEKANQEIDSLRAAVASIQQDLVPIRRHTQPWRWVLLFLMQSLLLGLAGWLVNLH